MDVKLTAAGLLACWLFVTSAPAADLASQAPARQRAILVTGASTGIGRNITEHLSAEGYFIYATARKDSDLAALAKLKNVQPIRMDVTRPQEIRAALDVVKQGGRGLYGLVNNAGIGTGYPFLEGNDGEFDLCMQVNVYGTYRVTQAFAPLVVAEKGRIVNMGSIAGLFGFPRGTAYTMSKHAIEAFTDSLGAELAELGVQVSVIEPGNYNSDIGKNAIARGLKIGPKFADRAQYKAPDEVTDAVRHALFDDRPHRRYLVVPDEDAANWTLASQLARVAQTNSTQAYRYDRAKLIELLDAAIANENSDPQ